MVESTLDIVTLVIIALISYLVGLISTIIVTRYFKDRMRDEKVYSERMEEYEKRLLDIMLRLEIIELRTRNHMKSQTKENHITSHKQEERVPKVKVRDDMELKVLRILLNGAKTSREIEVEIGRSREHTARFMKRLYDEGYVVRDTSSKPYKYRITDAGKSMLIQSSAG